MDETKGNVADRKWCLSGEREAHSREALDLMVMEGLIQLQDEVEPVAGGTAVTVGEVLGILPALPVRQRLDALAEGLELPEGETIVTMKSDELPRVVSMIPRVDTMPVSKPAGQPVLTLQRLGGGAAVLIVVIIISFLFLPRSEDRQGDRQGSQAVKAGAVERAAEKVIPVQRPAGQVLRPGQKRLSLEEKQTVLGDESEDLESCLPEGFRGAVKVQLKIKPNGAPFAIRLDTNDTSLKDCIRAKVFRWRFPRFSGPSDELSFQLGGKR